MTGQTTDAARAEKAHKTHHEDQPLIVPAPGLAAWQLVIDYRAGTAALRRDHEGYWLAIWPDVPVPGRLLITDTARLYELSWHGARYLPRRREIRRTLWMMPGQLPLPGEHAGLALLRCLVAGCERYPVSCGSTIPEWGCYG